MRLAMVYRTSGPLLSQTPISPQDNSCDRATHHRRLPSRLDAITLTYEYMISPFTKFY